MDAVWKRGGSGNDYSELKSQWRPSQSKKRVNTELFIDGKEMLYMHK